MASLKGPSSAPFCSCLFYNDFANCLCHGIVVQFAKDIVVYLSSKSVDEIESKADEDLECTLLGTSRCLAAASHGLRDLNLLCSGSKINSTPSFKYLGTILDQHLNLSANFDQKYKNASSRPRLLRKL